MSLKIQLKVRNKKKNVVGQFCMNSEWQSSAAPTATEKGKPKTYIDFQDVNMATLKDEHLMTMVDSLVDRATKREIFSFMDGHFGYN